MKIAQIIARVNKGGTAVWMEELVLGLRSQAHEVNLYAGQVQTFEEEDNSFTTLRGIRITGLGRSISVKDDYLSFSKLRKILIKEKFQIINTHTAKAGVIGRLAAMSLGKKRPAIVHTFHGHLLYGYFSKPISLVFTLIERFLASKSDVIIAAGNLVKNELISAGIGIEEKYVVARPGINLNQLENREETRAKLGISNESIVVGWLGRLAQIKRPDRLIAVAKELSDLVFVMGGDGELFEELKLEIPSNVILLGWTKPELIWAISDIAFLTSENEAQPISMIEAGLAGLPAVAENVGSVSEVIEDEITGHLVNNHNERVQAIRSLSGNPEQRIEMGNAAKNYCVNKFGKEQFLEAHRKAYELALKRRNRTA